MSLTITPINATLGAILTEVDLANLDNSTFRTIENAFHEYAVLVFPDQNLTEDEQVQFASRFGELELTNPDKRFKFSMISNQNADGSIVRGQEHRFKILRGNEGWHTDSSYMPISAKASILSAQVVPSFGGETEVADMRAAYDALDEKIRLRIEDLKAFHSLYESQAKIGHTPETGASYGFHTKGSPLRPLVKTHPITGRRALYIGRHAYAMPGLDKIEAQKLLDELVDFACQSPRVYAHKWRPGDVFMWDNRCVLHRACPYDYKEIRIMRHTRVAGNPDTEFASTVQDVRATGYDGEGKKVKLVS